jgi:predicted SAM-dependent methyltransferase/ADP-heptose:LPS heptosyltransferase
MTWRASDPQGNEGYKVRWELVRWTRGKGLDIGCGPQKTFPHFIGVDNNKDAALFNLPAHPDIMIDDAADLSMFASQSMDFVFSSHLLEHFPYEDVPKVLKEWFRVLKPNRHLVLYLPDEDEYPKVGEEGANTDHKWNINKDRLLEAMQGLNWDLVDFQKRNEANEYSLLFVFRKIGSGRHQSWQKPKPKKTAAVVRYGAYGDLLQASSVIAGLKKQGYHVTVYASPPGIDVILYDPNIDDFYIQDKDQVPNQYLIEFWDHEKVKYDKWVNLCESVEGTFLTIPGRTLHYFPPKVRHELADFNYIEMAHKIADVPFDPQMCFYATLAEMEWAKKERAKMGEYVIMWALAGSSVHKTWAGLDQTIASILLEFPKAHIVLVGGFEAKLLEQGWEKEPRVHLRSGEWKIRETLAFQKLCDMVIGPETGVMNAASSLPIPKVVFLSHSTEKNLTRDWTNTYVLKSEHTVCPGRGNNDAPACHQLHYNWNFCKQVTEGWANGTAQCQADIDGVTAWSLIRSVIRKSMEQAA